MAGCVYVVSLCSDCASPPASTVSITAISYAATFTRRVSHTRVERERGGGALL